jgi:hypothetical protein
VKTQGRSSRAVPSADPLAWPALIGLEHVVALGLSPTYDAARKACRVWPSELRVPNTGRRVLFKRDPVLRFLGL